MNLERLISPREKVQQDLHNKLAHACIGYGTEAIAGAAINLVITVVHRMNIKQADAEARWDELFGQGKALLRSRYKKGLDHGSHIQ